MRPAADVMTEEVLSGGTEGEGAGGKPTGRAAKPTTTSRIKARAARPASGEGTTSRSAPPTVTRGAPEVDLGEDDLDGVSFAFTTDAVADDPVALLAGGEAGDARDPDGQTDDSEGSPDGGPTRAPRWVALNGITTIVGAIAVALAVAVVLTLLTLGNRNALDSARTSAIGAAKADAVKLAGYDYRHLDRDFSAVLADSTPSFQRSFTQSSDALKTTLSKYHATAVAKVVSAGLVSATTSRAVVLVFLTQNISNSAQAKATSDRSQVELTLVHSGGRWLVDQVSLL